MTPLEVLTAGREVIIDPKHWTQRTLARDTSQNSVFEPWNPNATCFCSVGAIHRVVGPNRVQLKGSAKKLLNAALPTGWDDIVVFNDRNSHSDVIAVWDKAIALARHQ